jgi:predicted amidohydrolase YtcJ
MIRKALINGKVYQGRDRFCQAAFIAGNRIAATGKNEDLLNAAPTGTERLDIQGRLHLPGFYDCHLHLTTIGRMARMIDTRSAHSLEALIERGRCLIARLKPPGPPLSC